MSSIALPTGRTCDSTRDLPTDMVRQAAGRIGLDLSILRDLLDCAGPSLAAELRRRYLADLATARAGLSQARTCVEAERHAHILLALIGQAGAAALQIEVQLALFAARAGDAETLAAQIPAVIEGTAALATVIAGLPCPPERDYL